MFNPYPDLDDRLRELTGTDVGFDGYITAAPVQLSSAAVKVLQRNALLLQSFLETSSRLFFDDLRTDGPLSELLLRDVLGAFGPDFHRALVPGLRHIPRFFRTDQPMIDKVSEIQCPGSGWGEHALLADFYSDRGIHIDAVDRLPRAFADELDALLGGQARVHHLLDNASSLRSNLYFVNAVRRCSDHRFLGFDRGLAGQDCNFVRTHLFSEVATENFARPRRRLAEGGGLLYDYPLVAIFEMKALLALPFAQATCDAFTDEVRELFPHTTLIGIDGSIELPGREVLTAPQFAGLPRSRRQFFIKYAGADPSMNWGSRAVYNAADFTRARLQRLLTQIVDAQSSGGGPWILQEGVSQACDVEYPDITGTSEHLHGYQKLSVFHGPTGVLGAYRMVRRTKKVHGQADTVNSLVCLGGPVS